jgi:DNA-directed RNA polymerase subunit omega
MDVCSPGDQMKGLLRWWLSDRVSGAGHFNRSHQAVKEKIKKYLTGLWRVLVCPSRRDQERGPACLISMNAQILEEASKVITEPQVLINAVSRRVRQLTAGSRPMVEVEFRTGLADIALLEIAAGKLAVAPKAA